MSSGLLIEVLIVDDHKIVREGLKHILDESDNILVKDEASNGDEAFQMIQNSIHDRKILIQINRALELLTHDKSVPYVEYLQSVLSNPLAGIVKISDLIHNLSHNPSPRQIKKYSDVGENN